MTVSRLLSRRGFSPAALVLLLVTALVGGGLEMRPTPAAGCSLSGDDHAPDSQPREESADESSEDEEGESAKHAALGSVIAVELPASCAGNISDRPAWLPAGGRRDAAPIRGPPSRA